MVRLVWRTDVHLSDRAPAARTDNWADSCFDKLDQIKAVCEKWKAHALLDGGDLFHIKSPSRNSHALVQRVVEHHADYPCRVGINFGNHDGVYGDLSFLHQQPLGTLYASGVAEKLFDEHEMFFESEGVKVRVVGIPYHGVRYDMARFTGIKKGEEDILICVAHVLASPKGGTMFEGEDIVRYSDLESLDPDVWCFGHWHKNQGVQKVGSKTIVNIGSLTRGSLTQDEMERKPCIALLSCTKEGVDVRVVDLKVKPASEVFDVEQRVRIASRETTMSTFVDSIRKSLQGSEEKDIGEQVAQMEGLDETVRERALLYLESVG